MENAGLSTDPIKGHLEEHMKAVQHFMEGFKILARIIAREISQEAVNSEKHVNNGQDSRSKISGPLQDEGKLALSVKEVSKLLGLSRSVTYERIRTSQITSVRFGRRILVPRAKLEMALS